MGRPNTALVISRVGAVKQLRSIVRSRSLPHSLVRRARIVLLSASWRRQSERSRGHCGVSAPDRQSVAPAAISNDGHRRAARGNCVRAARAAYGDEQVAALLRKVLHSKPAAATHWSVRSVAAHTGISKSTVARYFALFGLQPHRSKSFKLSTDPFFVEKVRAIVGLYLNPPDNALVLCVDEKSQVQALERTQPVLPMGLGYVEGVTHDYFRHGTTTLFAALDIVDGAVISQCKPRHRHQEFLSFLKHLDANIPAELELHLIADNYATHKHPKVKAWLASHSRFHLHFTPTYSSWLNQVERWFALITQQAIRRGSFRTVRELVGKIDAYVAHYNTYKRPFVWTATADSIFDKLQRICKLINGTQHLSWVQKRCPAQLFTGYWGNR